MSNRDGNALTPWDQVTDYNGTVLNTSLAGTAFPAGYNAAVQVLQADNLNGIAGGEALRIRVTVNYPPLNETLVLEGYRTRYAPNFTQ